MPAINNDIIMASGIQSEAFRVTNGVKFSTGLNFNVKSLKNIDENNNYKGYVTGLLYGNEEYFVDPDSEDAVIFTITTDTTIRVNDMLSDGGENYFRPIDDVWDSIDDNNPFSVATEDGIEMLSKYPLSVIFRNFRENRTEKFYITAVVFTIKLPIYSNTYPAEVQKAYFSYKKFNPQFIYSFGDDTTTYVYGNLQIIEKA